MVFKWFFFSQEHPFVFSFFSITSNREIYTIQYSTTLSFHTHVFLFCFSVISFLSFTLWLTFLSWRRIQENKWSLMLGWGSISNSSHRKCFRPIITNWPQKKETKNSDLQSITNKQINKTFKNCSIRYFYFKVKNHRNLCAIFLNFSLFWWSNNDNVVKQKLLL